MAFLKKLFDFYVNASIHVSFSVLALVLMTNHMFSLPFNIATAGFAFFGTLVAYNFIKYADLLQKKQLMSKYLRNVSILSIAAAVLCAYFFFQLSLKTQIASAIFFGLTFLYAVPVFSKDRNFRNFTGIKIYIVALCWAGVTILLPLMDAEVGLTTAILLKFVQRFILVIILILIFEIIDLRSDAAELQTVPQKIGVGRTKFLGLGLLVLFYLLEFFQHSFVSQQLVINFILIVVTALFTIFANPNRSKYYTSFWVEIIPIFWLILEVYCC